ncbi:MAG TPA: hypothetical protein VG013_23015, partial [Gemmataceae bacterium]|nr:hypothetical protein [Gemmataceae bacterium]
MSKRWGWRWWALAYVGLAGTFYLAYRASPQARVTQEHYDQIENGMTELQVMSLLGWPTESPIGCGTAPRRTVKVWKARDVTVAVFFDSSGVACAKEWKA